MGRVLSPEVNQGQGVIKRALPLPRGVALKNHEFAFSAADFQQVRKLIYAHAGIALNDSKMPMVYSRLARRLRELRMPDFASYLKELRTHPDSPEWEAFVNALTTNLTSFFREGHHFQTLARLAPQWLRERGELKVWCSASSTGEEPYSIAMTLAESLGDLSRVSIVASDLDTSVLATAKLAEYPLDRLDKLSLERKKRFFLRGKGEKAGLVRIRPELSQIVDFMQINLLDKRWPLNQQFDAIFCRNVMIYFDKPTQYAILQRISLLLRPDGRLFVGHSEHLSHATDLFEHCGQTVYRKARSS